MKKREKEKLLFFVNLKKNCNNYEYYYNYYM